MFAYKIKVSFQNLRINPLIMIIIWTYPTTSLHYTLTAIKDGWNNNPVSCRTTVGSKSVNTGHKEQKGTFKHCKNRKPSPRRDRCIREIFIICRVSLFQSASVLSRRNTVRSYALQVCSVAGLRSMLVKVGDSSVGVVGEWRILSQSKLSK